MSGLEGALCRGRWWLFDSTDYRDHAAAAELCAACPAIEACRVLVTEVSTTVAYNGPVGTWAGQLYGTKRERPVIGRPPLPREHGTPRGYFQHKSRSESACGDCKDAHKVTAWLRANAQVNPPNRTADRVESGAVSGPESASRIRGHDRLVRSRSMASVPFQSPAREVLREVRP